MQIGLDFVRILEDYYKGKETEVEKVTNPKHGDVLRKFHPGTGIFYELNESEDVIHLSMDFVGSIPEDVYNISTLKYLYSAFIYDKSRDDGVEELSADIAKLQDLEVLSFFITD